MIIANTVLRELTIPWRGAEYQCSRVVAGTSYYGQMQITSAAVYGAPRSPTFKRPLALTHDILTTLTEELVEGQQGLRVIAGDFNADIVDFDCIRTWFAKGWVELQHYALQAWGRPLEPTCKGKTFRDFVFLSPERLPFLQSVHMNHELFPDHSALFGRFSLPIVETPLRHWPQAHQLPWSDLPTSAWHSSLTTWTTWTWGSDLTKSFAAWSLAVEASIRIAAGSSHGHLLHGCFGRGHHVQPQPGYAQQRRLKPPRPGELAPISSLLGKTTHLWYKQLRRLQSLLHALRAGRTDPSARFHQAMLWISIRRASGFAHGFVAWWTQRRIRLQSSPRFLPTTLPTLEIFENIFADYHCNFRSFERWQLDQRARALKHRREGSLKHFFQDLNPASRSSLDYLERTVEATITAVDPPTGLVSLDRPLPVLHAATLNDIPVKVVHLLQDDTTNLDPSPSTTGYLIEGDLLPVPGQRLQVRQPLPSCDQIHAELGALWHPRWDHRDPLDHLPWDRITAFARTFLPRLPLRTPVADVPAIRVLLRDGQALRTRGPDGWSAEDFRHFPDHLLQDLSNLYQQIEAGNKWPSQLLVGHVHCLEKHPHAVQAGDFRPVVLYSTLYRLWGCIHARSLLAQMEAYIPYATHGYLAGRQSSDITYWLQCAIEFAVKANEMLCGVTTDIRRCFNYLPRWPLLIAAQCLGLPSSTCTGWTSFLEHNVRTFCVRQQLGPLHHSTSGVPEGDSLSCVGMLMASWMLHAYMVHYSPRVHAMSFVDNVELIASGVADLCQGFAALTTWGDTLQLEFDPPKTHFWATQPAMRAQLKALGLRVTEAGSDLGAAMVYGGRLRNKAFTDRIKSVAPCFDRLRKLSASMWHKQLGLRVAIWPRALHHCSHLVFGMHWITKLRSQAMVALHANRAGASPILHLAFTSDPELDPGYFAFWKTFAEFYRQVHKSLALRDWWKDYVLSPPTTKTFGPFGAMTRRCDFLHLWLDEDLVLHFPDDLRLSLLQTDLAALRRVLEYQWKQSLIRCLPARASMAGLDGIEPYSTFVYPKPSTLADQELLKCIWNGTFYLSSQKAKFDYSNTGDCLMCGQPDSFAHRALRCPALQEVRNRHPQCVQEWTTLPPALANHALLPASPFQFSVWHALQALPWEPRDWKGSPVEDQMQHLFVDGSQRWGFHPGLTLVSWSVVLSNSATVLQAGLLPGVLQTVDRGELFAALQGLRWAAHHCRIPCIWTDSQYVHDGLNELSHIGVVPSHWRNQDLWGQVADLLACFGTPVSACKVKAHRSTQDAVDDHDEWTIRFNQIADVAAKAVLQSLPSEEVAAAHAAARRWHALWSERGLRCRDFLLDLARTALRVQSNWQNTWDHEEDVFECLDVVFGDALLADGSFTELFPVSPGRLFAESAVLQKFWYSPCTCSA